MLPLGTVASLNLLDIQQTSTTNGFGFITAKGAGTFTFGTGNHQRTFLVLNDSTNGFSALTDAVIEISGYKSNLTNLGIV